MAKAEVREARPTSFRPAEARSTGRNQPRARRGLWPSSLAKERSPADVLPRVPELGAVEARGLREDLPRIPHRGRRPLAGLIADIREGEG